MDAFEQVISEILWRRGYWPHASVKVNLTPKDKHRIGRPSSPRWELDVVGYQGKDNSLLVVECKSYLDSRGVKLCAFDGSNAKSAERYKLFTNAELRDTVLNRLCNQLAECGACAPNPTVKLGLACGRIAGDADRKGLHELFATNGWVLWDEQKLWAELKDMSSESYENQVSAVVAKLIHRGHVWAKGD